MRQIRARITPVNSLNVLRTALQEEWEVTPQEEIPVLIDNKSSRNSDPQKQYVLLGSVFG